MNEYKKIYALAEQYRKKHGNDKIVGTLEYTYGTIRAVKILENANGRKIEVKYIKGCVDNMVWRYEGDEKWTDD